MAREVFLVCCYVAAKPSSMSVLFKEQESAGYRSSRHTHILHTATPSYRSRDRSAVGYSVSASGTRSLTTVGKQNRMKHRRRPAISLSRSSSRSRAPFSAY